MRGRHGYRRLVLLLVLFVVERSMAQSWQANGDRIPRFGLFQIQFSSELTFENPFDVEANRIEVRFQRPSGDEDRVFAFWFQDYSSELVDGTEVLRPHGAPHFRVRYTPSEVGRYRFSVRLKVGDRTTDLGTGSFVVEPSSEHGFIRRSPDPRYFQYADGTPYFAVGHNVCWVDAAGTHRYREYFDKMAAHGENATRIWMIYWNVALEWTGPGYPPLGQYHLGNAWKLDRIFDLAAERGIAIKLCLDSFNALRIRPPYAYYQENPYAQENGGFLEAPEQFFTDPRAKALYRRRVNYLVARYAWRTNLLAWELWNEVDIIERYVSEEVTAWHQEMARFLRELDPYDHLITTSFANPEGDPAIWSLPEMDFTQTHQYNAPDIADVVAGRTVEKLGRYGKPHLFGEFGVDSGGPHPEKDPSGVGLHNGLWASVLSGGAGTAMLWWWDNYLDPQDLYWHFDGIARFVAGIPWPTLELKPLRTEYPQDLPLRVLGLQTDRFAICWIQNRHHTWKRAGEGNPIAPIEGGWVWIAALHPGSYRVELWDTWAGRVRETRAVSVGGEGLYLPLPAIERDIALKVAPVP